MLEAITRRMADKSVGEVYQFVFYCDICGKTWTSEPVRASRQTKGYGVKEPEAEHTAAYERANLEAMRHFNRCNVCKRWVCDDCFRIQGERDCCSECVAK